MSPAPFCPAFLKLNVECALVRRYDSRVTEAAKRATYTSQLSVRHFRDLSPELKSRSRSFLDQRVLILSLVPEIPMSTNSPAMVQPRRSSGDSGARTARKSVRSKSVTYVLGTFCH